MYYPACDFEDEIETDRDWRPQAADRIDDWRTVEISVSCAEVDPEEIILTRDNARHANRLKTHCRQAGIAPKFEIARYSYCGVAAREFVDSNHDVYEAMVTALPLISSIFGADAALTVVLAPDTDNPEYDSVVCYIKAAPDLDKALDQLTQFGSEWEKVPNRTSDKLSFAVEID